MNERETAGYCVDAMLAKGADKSACSVRSEEKSEFNVESNEISLLRTTFDTKASFKALVGGRKGTSDVNGKERASLDAAVMQAVDNASASKPEDENDISEAQPAKTFTTGPDEADYDTMFDRLRSFLEYTRSRYPKTNIRNVYFSFSRVDSSFRNSNGVDFTVRKGIYRCGIMFSSQEEKTTSSFNYSGFSTLNLDREIKDYGSINALLEQSEGQIHTKAPGEKFEGEVIVTPDCFDVFWDEIAGTFLGDYALVSGTSLLKDSLGKPVADQLLTVRLAPTSDEIADKSFVTLDGYAASDMTVIGKGVLESFLLHQYASKKTGKPRAANDSDALVVDPGSASLEDMVKSVKKGVLLCRFSAGGASGSGDFSGVAKNSYYIENGEIAHPLSETMISGNLVPLLRNITAISRERIDFGSAILPWVRFGGLTISGK